MPQHTMLSKRRSKSTLQAPSSPALSQAVKARAAAKLTYWFGERRNCCRRQVGSDTLFTWNSRTLSCFRVLQYPSFLGRTLFCLAISSHNSWIAEQNRSTSLEFSVSEHLFPQHNSTSMKLFFLQRHTHRVIKHWFSISMHS